MKNQIIKSKRSILRGSNTQKEGAISVGSIKAFEPIVPEPEPEEVIEQSPEAQAAAAFDLEALEQEYNQKEAELKQHIDDEVAAYRQAEMSKVEEALARHQNLQIDQSAMSVDFLDPQMRSDEGGLRLTPDMLGDKGGLDGFYIAVLTKT